MEKRIEREYNLNMINKFANILMPIMGNLGHIQFVLIAIVGGILAVNGINNLTLGAIYAVGCINVANLFSGIFNFSNIESLSF